MKESLSDVGPEGKTKHEAEAHEGKRTEEQETLKTVEPQRLC